MLQELGEELGIELVGNEFQKVLDYYAKEPCSPESGEHVPLVGPPENPNTQNFYA